MIDESVAWELVLAVRDRVGAGVTLPLTVTPEVPVDSSPSDIRLEVGHGGTWLASPEPTDAARDLFDLFLPLASRPRFIVGQLGQSLDGRIATETGASHFVTGQADIRRLHRLRALVDAVVVGAGTVAADDPRLTVREVEGENPTRVVLDPEARLDPQRRVFADGVARTILVRRAPPELTQAQAFRDEIVVPSLGEGRLDLRSLVAALEDQGLRRVLVEGGGITVSRFLQEGVLDRLHVTVAPLILGSGKASFTLPPVRSLTEAIRPPVRHFRLGEDVLFDLDLRR